MSKRVVPWIIFGSLFGLLFLGLARKDRLTNYMSGVLIDLVKPEVVDIAKTQIDSLYNYVKNKQPYHLTFLEFGAKGCSACRRMESVMEDIRYQFQDQVNVVFINLRLPENMHLIKYFGIAAIPTQVLLNKEGVEYFRHTGYLSSKELEGAF